MFEVPLGPDLLGQAKKRVDNRHAAYGDGAPIFLKPEESDRGRHHQGIEKVEEIAPDDVSVLSPDPAWRAIDPAKADTLGDLRGSQTCKHSFSLVWNAGVRYLFIVCHSLSP